MIVHKPVLLEEVIECLQPKENQNFIDCTVGSGGHSEEILKATGPSGKFLGLDWDIEAIHRSRKRLISFSDRVTLINKSYIELIKVVEDLNFNKVSGILLDLGLSTDQLKNSGRGFSFQIDEPLDMRFSLDSNLTAEKILNKYSQSDLARVFKEYGEERAAKSLAKLICEYRKEDQIKTTFQLVNLIIKVVPFNFKTRTHPATKVFQALRIEVNQELENVKSVLKDALSILVPGGRLAVISFHSLEDRIVKQFFKKQSLDCSCPPKAPVCQCSQKASLKIITKKPIIPSEEEIFENFKSRSAKLRVIEKL